MYNGISLKSEKWFVWSDLIIPAASYIFFLIPVHFLVKHVHGYVLFIDFLQTRTMSLIFQYIVSYIMNLCSLFLSPLVSLAYL